MKECKQCLDLEKLPEPLNPWAVRGVVVVLILLLGVTLGLFISGRAYEGGIFAILTLVGFCSLGTMLYVEIVCDRVLHAVLDTMGNLHVHSADPRANAMVIGEADRLLAFGSNAEQRPYLMEKNTPVLLIRVRGTIDAYRRQLQNRWLLIDTRRGKFEVRGAEGVVIHGDIRTIDELKYILEFMSEFESHIHAIDTKSCLKMASAAMLEFLINEIAESKEGMGKSKHAAVIRRFCERMRDDLSVDGGIFRITPQDHDAMLETIWTNIVATQNEPVASQ